MISNFSFCETELPHYNILKSLKTSGFLSKLQNSIKSDIKSQQFVPQNQFTHDNFPKLVKLFNNDSINFTSKDSYSSELYQYKVCGPLKLSTNSTELIKMNFSKEDRDLNDNFPKILKRIITKRKRLPINKKKFYEKLVLWLVKMKENPKIPPKDYVTLLRNLNETKKERKLAIDEQFKHPDFEHYKHFFDEEEEFIGLIYPKMENIIDFWEMPEPQKNVKIYRSHNIIVRNNRFEEDMSNPMSCTFWKMKDIKRFFIIYLIKTNDFDKIAKELNKSLNEVRLFFQITAEFFDLKNSLRIIKKSTSKTLVKDFLNEIYELLTTILQSHVDYFQTYEPSYPTNEIFFSLSTFASLIYIQRLDS